MIVVPVSGHLPATEAEPAYTTTYRGQGHHENRNKAFVRRTIKRYNYRFTAYHRLAVSFPRETEAYSAARVYHTPRKTRRQATRLRNAAARVKDR